MFDSMIEEIVIAHNQGNLKEFAEKNWNTDTAWQWLWDWCDDHKIMIYYRCGVRKHRNHKMQLRKGTLTVTATSTSFVFSVLEAVVLAWLDDFTAIHQPQIVNEDTQ